MRLAGKVAVITGGGTGIGRAAALALANEGADIAINFSRSSTEADETAASVQAIGRRAITVQASVGDDEAVRSMTTRVVAELGRIDVLVNSAGTTRFVPYPDLEGLTDEIWDEILTINLKGAFYCSRACTPHMKRGGAGSIVNIASVAGVTGFGSSVPYSVSKGALINLTRTLARALAPDIRVNAIAPGVVDTRWIVGKDEFRDAAIATTPFGRIATPEDVAEVVAFFAASASFVTGEVIVVDGGKTIGPA
jgi:3-oxoacyl-[acyl-carrier protein] reductase